MLLLLLQFVGRRHGLKRQVAVVHIVVSSIRVIRRWVARVTARFVGFAPATPAHARNDLANTVLRVHAREEVPSVANTAATQYILKTFPFDPKRNLREFISLTGSKFIAMALSHVAKLREEVRMERCFSKIL